MKRNMIIGMAIFVAFGLNLIFTVLVHKDLSSQIKAPVNAIVTEKYYVTKNELQNWQSTGDSEKIQEDIIELGEPIELENGELIWEIKE